MSRGVFIGHPRRRASGSSRRRRASSIGVEGLEPIVCLDTGMATVAPVDGSVDRPVALLDLEGSYRGYRGGLYDGGSNAIPSSHLRDAEAAVAQILPRDAQGGYAPETGRIGFLSIGQSTTGMIFSTFQARAQATPGRNPRLTVINGGQDGMVLPNWQRTARPWVNALNAVQRAGLTRNQVQVVWISLAQLYPHRYGAFPSHAERYAADLSQVITRAKRIFPHLQVAYISTRIFGGYGPQGVDPEPYAYEAAFGARSVIMSQIAGDAGLNFTPERGRVEAPLLLWGPYLWANGTQPSSTGLTWARSDFAADGVHPSPTGRAKAASELLEFFTTEPTAVSWFLA